MDYKFVLQSETVKALLMKTYFEKPHKDNTALSQVFSNTMFQFYKNISTFSIPTTDKGHL